ncbi:MAG: DUF2752 domain-containing protein [Prolixibacteraceae bacterium]|nr:DUF2752 domain-containing protein [Prolixibacteraceae bacterium]MBN2648618.1 DUF2752 domain-containing protein [Prolixibacteraceae bacterium]
MLEKKKIVFFCLVITILAVLVVIYTKSNPDDSHFFPKCPFKLITGYECPGCGSQRAVHHLLNMKIGSAIQANALLVFSIPYIIILFFAELLESKYRFFKRIYKTLFNPKAIWVIFGIIIFWWIFRNL